MSDPSDGADSLEALRLEYEYVRDENLRLRDSRASITRQLGPLPIGAAVVAGLVTGFTAEVHSNGWLWTALALFVFLVVVSILYSGMKPYRVLRREKEAKASIRPRSTSSRQAWYEGAIDLEKAIYGQPSSDTGIHRYLPKARITGLQDGHDRERVGLFVVQGLFALVIVLLIVSRLT